MKLIAESGGTKTQWCAVSVETETAIIPTMGLNPNFVPEDDFRRVIISEVLPGLNYPEITSVFFYGAGCAGKAMEDKVRNGIRSALPQAEVFVFSDLTGAARGLLGTGKGFICMIGTGSNSGWYDGTRITANVPPLGFILGDEGSGAYLGKRLLADFLRGIMPPGLAEEFKSRYGAEKDDIVSHVYRGVFPSRFIGEFVRFLNDFINESYCRELVRNSLQEFVNRNLRLYNLPEGTEIAVTGSVAWHFRSILEEVLDANGFRITTIKQGPIEGLIKYHRER